MKKTLIIKEIYSVIYYYNYSYSYYHYSYYHYYIKATFSFHCNCFVCSMLDLIYSSSILIDSCRCLPVQKKKKKYYFSHL